MERASLTFEELLSLLQTVIVVGPNADGAWVKLPLKLLRVPTRLMLPPE